MRRNSQAVHHSWLFDGIDHPLRIKQGATTAYYELDLAGNVRALRGPSGTNFGTYRYSAFGQTLVDSTTVTQSLRWKGRWYSSVAGGIYDVRARQWSPELAVFLGVDELGYFDTNATLWSWPNQNPLFYADPLGRWAVALAGVAILGAAATYLALQALANSHSRPDEHGASRRVDAPLLPSRDLGPRLLEFDVPR